jgi:hypothetical protein
MPEATAVAADPRFERAVASFRRDCDVVATLLGKARSERIKKLRWFDEDLLPLVASRDKQDALLARNTGTVGDAHGFRRIYWRKAPPLQQGSVTPSVWHLPGLPTQPWFPPDALARRMSEAWAGIREDFLRVRAKMSPHPDSGDVVSSGSWPAIMVTGAGGRLDSSLHGRLPHLAPLLDERDVCLNFGFLFFAGTIPGTKIDAHSGSSNMRLRHHLAVICSPDLDAEMIVDDRGERWVEGECLVFDDAYAHAVVHRSGSERVILSIDTWHPGLDAEEIAILSDPVFARFAKVGAAEKPPE